MITKIAKLVAGWLAKEGVISENDSELYEYAMYSFLFGTLPILIAVIWGIILGMLVESILFMLPFILIRKFSGGYHLKSPVCCFVTSVSLVGGALIILRYVVQRSLLVPLTVVVALAGILLCILSPIDSASRQLNQHEIRVFRKIARLMTLVSILVYVVFIHIEIYNVAVPIGGGIILSAVLQLPVVLERLWKRVASSGT